MTSNSRDAIFGAMARFQEEMEERARRRGSWELRVHRLEEQPGDDLSEHTAAPERLAMMWPLALEAWRLSGRQVPDYPRAEIPVRVISDSSREGDAAS